MPAALAASTRGRFTPRDGDAADRVVLDRDPLSASVAELAGMPVQTTMLAGRWTWQADRSSSSPARLAEAVSGGPSVRGQPLQSRAEAVEQLGHWVDADAGARRHR